MKFRFCGDGDCPDWVLAGIHSNLSTLSSIKLRLLTQHVAKAILGEPFNEDKLKETFGLQKHDMQAPKAAIACLKYLLENAVKYETLSATFSEELQQLGLPKEHATAICRVLDDFGAKIKSVLAAKSLTINQLDDVTIFAAPPNTIECVQLQFKIKNEIVDGRQQETCRNVNVSKSDVPILLEELKTIKRLMNEMDYEKKYNNTAVE